MGSIPVGAVCLFSANSANSLFCLICEALLLLIATVRCAKIERLAARLVPISIYYRPMSQYSVSFSVFSDAKSPFWLAQLVRPDGSRVKKSTKVPVEGGVF